MRQLRNILIASFTAQILLTSCGGNDNSSQSKNMVSNIEKLPMADDAIVRLSKIEVYPEYLHEYLDYAMKVGEISLCTEPGVLTMYAMQDNADSCRITILETYASQASYKEHISSPHFQQYKQGTLHMVKHLELCDQTPLNPMSIITNYIAE